MFLANLCAIVETVNDRAILFHQEAQTSFHREAAFLGIFASNLIEMFLSRYCLLPV